MKNNTNQSHKSVDSVQKVDITGFAGHVEMTYTTIKRGRVHIG